MKRDEILNQAKQCVTVDRQKVHGDAEDNFATIAALWKTYIEQACICGEDTLTILPEDVAAMMTYVAEVLGEGGREADID